MLFAFIRERHSLSGGKEDFLYKEKHSRKEGRYPFFRKKNNLSALNPVLGIDILTIKPSNHSAILSFSN